jgi:phage-related protein
MALYTIEFYGNKRNNEIESFIKSLQKQTIAKTLRIMDLLTKYGLHIGMPYVKKIQSDLFELRVKGGEEVRYIFTTKGTVCYMLVAFKKKTNKIPTNYLTIAKKRMYNV